MWALKGANPGVLALDEFLTEPSLSDVRPPVFSSKGTCGWLLGGSVSNNFLVSCEGLTQPRARRGLVVFGPASSQHTPIINNLSLPAPAADEATRI